MRRSGVRRRLPKLRRRVKRRSDFKGLTLAATGYQAPTRSPQSAGRRSRAHRTTGVIAIETIMHRHVGTVKRNKHGRREKGEGRGPKAKWERGEGRGTLR